MKVSSILYAAGLGSILMSMIYFVRGKSNDDGERERTSIFLGLWAPTFFALGKVLEDREDEGEDQPLHL